MLASSRSAGPDAIGVLEQMRGEPLRPGAQGVYDPILCVGKVLLRAIPVQSSEAPFRSCSLLLLVSGEAHSRARSLQPKSLTRSLTCCHSPPSVSLTPKSLLHEAPARSQHHNRKNRSGRTRLSRHREWQVPNDPALANRLARV